MASETFFDDGERVMLEKWWVKGLKHENALLKLTGTVVGCDDTLDRACCYYDVRWDATDEELRTLNKDPEDMLQSDAITRLKKRRK
jgi:hypothetical protein